MIHLATFNTFLCLHQILTLPCRWRMRTPTCFLSKGISSVVPIETLIWILSWKTLLILLNLRTLSMNHHQTFKTPRFYLFWKTNLFNFCYLFCSSICVLNYPVSTDYFQGLWLLSGLGILTKIKSFTKNELRYIIIIQLISC